MAPSVFLPALVYEVGNGAVTPIIALTALDLGATTGEAALSLALLGIGQVLGDVPAGWLADELGDRRAMLAAAGIAVTALLTSALARSYAVFGLALLVLGACNATYYLARQAYVNDVIPPQLRARALSTLAGSHRIGLFIGPFVGAAAISLGSIRSAYLVGVVAAASSALLLVVVPDVVLDDDKAPSVRGTVSAMTMLGRHRRLFATLGLAVTAIGATRAARQTVLPLWAAHLGLNPERTSLVFGFAAAVEIVMFYPAGKMMDHWGRLAVALPAMSILGGAMLLVPVTGSMLTLSVVAMVMGFGNGMGSGIMMTIGADAAPRENRVKFLSIWRLHSDSGSALGPVVVSVVAGLTTLAVGIASAGVIGLLAVGGLWRWVPRYSPYATRATARARHGGD